MVRWEVPVHLSVHFGPSVSAHDRAVDAKAIAKVAHIVAKAARHPVKVNRTDGNFYLFVVSDAELANLGPVLEQKTGMSATAARSIARMQPHSNCLVMAIPQADKTKGYRSAVAVVRAGLSAAGRESCFYEEIAQGMGLPNDCKERLTIFNDNNEFKKFTELDLTLLRLVYDKRFTSGMTPDAVMTTLDHILAAGS